MPLKAKLAGHERGRSGGCVRINTLPVAEVRLQKMAKDVSSYLSSAPSMLPLLTLVAYRLVSQPSNQ